MRREGRLEEQTAKPGASDRALALATLPTRLPVRQAGCLETTPQRLAMLLHLEGLEEDSATRILVVLSAITRLLQVVSSALNNPSLRVRVYSALPTQARTQEVRLEPTPTLVVGCLEAVEPSETMQCEHWWRSLWKQPAAATATAAATQACVWRFRLHDEHQHCWRLWQQHQHWRWVVRR